MEPSKGMTRIRWSDGDGRPVRVMAVVDNWVMARRPGRIPFVVFLSDWDGRFSAATPSAVEVR